MAEELKVCPICENKGENWKLQIDNKKFGIILFHRGHCYQCGARLYWVVSRAEAIKDWNTRPREEELERSVLELSKLLGLAKCSACDGSGSIPHQIGDDEWEAEQCQWCYEKDFEIQKAEKLLGGKGL